MFLLAVVFAAVVNTPCVAATVKDGHDAGEINVVSWNAPFLSSSSGYGSEATSFLVGLDAVLDKKRWALAAGLSHGDSVDYRYVSGLSPDMMRLFEDADRSQQRHVYGAPPRSRQDPAAVPDATSAPAGVVVVICHSEPGAWSTQDGPRYESPVACPPEHLASQRQGIGRTATYYIGRTMFETDRLPAGWADRMNELMDEVWVPTKYHKQIFHRDGVTTPITVVGQGIDVRYWDPSRVQPLEWEDIAYYSGARGDSCSEGDYKFLSVFKWERRKAPDVLLPSFWKAFPQGGACLIIVTSLYHSDEDRIFDEIDKYWKESNDNNNSGEEGGKNSVHATTSALKGVILMSGLELEELVRLYRTVDAFVLSSRGEGWGRPVIEAMAMGLPVIATNWSGPTEYMTDDVGYLLPIEEGLVDAGLDPFPQHRWAEPSENELRHLLRSIAGENRTQAKIKGMAARHHIVQHWSNEVLAKQVANHLDRIVLKARASTGEKSIVAQDNWNNNNEL